MTQPSYADCKPYIDNGDTPADIADDLSHMTVSPITSKVIREFLIDEQLWYESPNGWGGNFHVAFSDITIPANAATTKSLELMWQTAFQGAKDDLQTTTQVRPNGNAKGFQPGPRLIKTMYRLLNRNSVAVSSFKYLTQSQLDDFFALGGGLMYPEGVTEAEVNAAIAAKADQDAEIVRQQTIESVRANIENTWINPAISDGVSTAADVAAAIKAGL